MPRDEFYELVAELERLGLMNEALALMRHLLAIQRVIESMRTKTTAHAFARTVGAENRIR